MAAEKETRCRGERVIRRAQGTESGPARRTTKKWKPNVPLGAQRMTECAGITNKDNVVIATDAETWPVARELIEAIVKKEAAFTLLPVESFGKRPLTTLPPGLKDRIRSLNPTVSILAIAAVEGELGFRGPLAEFLMKTIKTRHIHAPTITLETLGGQAMCADYTEVARLTHAVYEIVKDAKEISVTHPNGTNLVIELDPKRLKWVPSDGQYHKQGTGGNIPDGEVFGTPRNAEGILVTNCVGDFFGKKYGILEDPLIVEIKNCRVIGVSCMNKTFEQEFWDYANRWRRVKRGRNTDRIGEVAFGTNTALTDLTGRPLEDEKAAGFHAAIGDPLSSHGTKARWTVVPNQHCDIIIPGVTAAADGRMIMENGEFLI